MHVTLASAKAGCVITLPFLLSGLSKVFFFWWGTGFYKKA
jgi:hypothetical protein